MRGNQLMPANAFAGNCRVEPSHPLGLDDDIGLGLPAPLIGQLP